MQSTSTTSAAPAAADLSRRVGTILDQVEEEAGRIREETRAEADRILAAARREADALVADRRRRIDELTGELVARSEAMVARLGDSEPVREGFDNLVRALGEASERLAAEIEGEAGPPAVSAGAPAPRVAGASGG
jgi:hypothetical protein